MGSKPRYSFAHTSSPGQRRIVLRCDRCQSLCFGYFWKQIRYCNENLNSIFKSSAFLGDGLREHHKERSGMRTDHIPSLLSAWKAWGVSVLKMQDQQWAILLAQEALGEKKWLKMCRQRCARLLAEKWIRLSCFKETGQLRIPGKKIKK